MSKQSKRRGPSTFRGHPLGSNDAPPEAERVIGDRIIDGIDDWFWDGLAWAPDLPRTRGTHLPPAGSHH